MPAHELPSPQAASPVPPEHVQYARHARRLAQQAGDLLIAAVGEPRVVKWKIEDDKRSAVTDLDESIELLLRSGIRAVFPAHAIVGEEHEDLAARDSPITWVIDPIDGTANFSNGVPLFAVSVGVVEHGVPIAGAIWCASTPMLRAGTYHAVRGGTLCFDDEHVAPPVAHAVRGLVSEPGGHAHWWAIGDSRSIGSAATECAWVAAGALQACVLARPRAWDVAAGIVLAGAANCHVRTLHDEHPRREWPQAPWQPFDTFARDTSEPLREWSRPVLMARIGTVLAPAGEVQS